MLSLYLGPEDLLINLDVTFKDDLGEGGVLMAIDRIEGEVMDEYPQATRVFAEAESLNQVYRQRRDRKELFAAYEEEKLFGERFSERRAARRQRNEELRARRAKRLEEIANAYNRARRLEAEANFDAVYVESEAGLRLRKKLFSEIPGIEGERIVLNRVVDTDADALRDMIENPLVQRYEPAFLFEKQRDDVGETIRLMYGELFENKESLILAIRVKKTGELAGLAEFYGLRDSLHKVSIGYRLRECWWGKGLATEAARLMVGYLYGETDIEIITASTMIENTASAHVLEKADFVRTARYVEEDWGLPKPAIVDKWFC